MTNQSGIDKKIKFILKFMEGSLRKTIVVILICRSNTYESDYVQTYLSIGLF